jgi:hypothetical protein
MLNTPHKIAAAVDGRVFIADRANGRVRVIGATDRFAPSPAATMRVPRVCRSITSRFGRPNRPERAINDVTASVAAALPPAAGATPLAEQTLVDRHLFASWARDTVPHAEPASDFEFARRVFLDLTGRIPTKERLLAFVRSTAPDKRDRLIDELLDSQAWADFWTYWYGDLLRVTHNRVGNASMKHFDAWLRQSLRDDKPYNRLVTELLRPRRPTPTGCPMLPPRRFLARWYVAGATMYTDQYEDTATRSWFQSARLFLGVNYQCVSCHNGRAHLEKVDVHLTTQTRRDFLVDGRVLRRHSGTRRPLSGPVHRRRRWDRLRHQGGEHGAAAAFGPAVQPTFF